MEGSRGRGARLSGSPSASRVILGRGSFYTLATAAPALTAIAVIPAVTRLLSVPEYRLVAVCTVLIQVGYILAALGMGAAITRQYFLAEAGAAGARGLVLQGAVLAASVTALAALTGHWWCPAVLGRPMSAEILLALAACLGGAWMVLAQAYLRGADRVGSFIGLAILAGLVGPTLGLGAIAAADRTALVYLVGVGAGYLLAGGAGLVVTLRSGPLDASITGLRGAARIGLPTIPHQVSLYIALAGLVVVADRLLGDGGRANVALTIGAGATVITAAMNNAWAPVIYRTPAERRGAVLTETTRTIAILTVAVAGSVALLAPWILRVAAPGSYSPDTLVPAVALASAAALPSVVYLASGHLIFASGRTGWLAVTTPLAVTGGLLWAAWWTAEWSMNAVGSGYLVTYVLLAVGTTLLQRRVAPLPWRPPFLVWTGILWIAAAALAWALPTESAASLVRVPLALGLVAVAALGARRSTARSRP